MKFARWPNLIALCICAIAPAQANSGHTVTITVLARGTQGHAVTDLKERDFEITEKNQPLALSGLRRMGGQKGFITNRPPDGYIVSNRPLAAFNIPQPVNILLLDTANTDPEFQRWMEAQSLRFFMMMRPTENVAVYQLNKSGLHLLHEFSNAPEAMGDTISEGGLVRGTERYLLKPERIVPLEPATAEELEREGGDASLRAERYRKTCAALTDMARYLNEFSGRKNLLWLSADFPPLGDAASKDQDRTGGACRQMLFAFAATNTAVYPIDVRSPVVVEPFARVLPGHMSALTEKRKSALSHTLSASMLTLAAVTGGQPIVNSGQLAEVMTDAVDATRSAYEIKFQVPASSWDGKMHAMHVSTTARDVDIIAKRLYFAGTIGGPLPAPFDSPAVGISVTAVEKSNGTRMSIFVAGRDLTWKPAGDMWEADAQITTGSELPIVKGFTITKVEHDNIAQHSVSTEAETRSTIAVRDMATGKTGTVTIPVNAPK
ncbi:MAG TPA: VWA domain-containing protein [Bryobacteraceae bacterium]